MHTLATPLDAEFAGHQFSEAGTHRFINLASQGSGHTGQTPQKPKQFYNRTITEEEAHVAQERQRYNQSKRDEISPTVMVRGPALPPGGRGQISIGSRREQCQTSDFIISKHNSQNSNEETTKIFSREKA